MFNLSCHKIMIAELSVSLHTRCCWLIANNRTEDKEEDLTCLYCAGVSLWANFSAQIHKVVEVSTGVVILMVVVLLSDLLN